MSQILPDGFLIVFEGLDGVGKTTQLQQAKDVLTDDGWPIELRRNLGSTPIGEELRKIILGQTPRPPATDLYMTVAIQEALIEQLSNDRQAGKLILMDRCPLSLAAYQSYGSGLELDKCLPYVKDGMAKFKPDLIILYKANIEEALKRAQQQSVQPDYFESKPLDFFERVSNGYDELIRDYNVVIIDADRSVEEVHQDTMTLINQALAKLS